jgi:lysophospholipase L1-like esterase
LGAILLLTACSAGQTTLVTSAPATVESVTVTAVLPPATTAFARPPLPSPTPVRCDHQGEEAMRFLALGDSYTIGESVPEAERWPNQLAAALQAEGTAVEFPEIIARTGWTTDELIAGIATADPRGPYEMVSLLIGVNNQYRRRGLDEYREQFRVLLQRAITFAGDEPARVLVLSIPDWSVVPYAERDRRTPAEILAEIAAFNEINKEESLAAGVFYVDITPISQQAAREDLLVAADGLHPSAKMYAAWVEVLVPVACEILGEG